jgi:hypothetical protein
MPDRPFAARPALTEEGNPALMTTAVKSRTRTVTDIPANGAAAAPVRRRLSDFACKQVMAVTGIVFGLYVLLHMLGNLKAYLGPEEFGSYASDTIDHADRVRAGRATRPHDRGSDDARRCRDKPSVVSTTVYRH